MADLAAGVKDRTPAFTKNKSPAKQNDAKKTETQAANSSLVQMQSALGNRAMLQMMRSGVLNASGRGAGTSGRMPAAVQAKMENAFNTDFSGVSIHEGTKAASIGARAYTQGNHINFAPGQYKPGSQDGQRLLGHELAHVVQQREGRVSAPQGKGLPIVASPALESEADRNGDRAARGLAVRSGLAAQLRQGTESSIGFQLNAGAPIQGNWFSRNKKKENEQGDEQQLLAESPEQEEDQKKEEEARKKEMEQQEKQEPEPVIGKPENVVKGGGPKPSSDDIKLNADDIEDPEKALEGYMDFSAKNVKEMGRHEFKINVYRDYLEGDLDFVLPAVQQFKALNERKEKLLKEKPESFGKTGDDKEKAAKKDSEKQKLEELDKINKDMQTIRDTLSESKEIETKDGKKIKVKGEEPEQAEQNAIERYRLARGAVAVVEAEKPVVGYAYDKIKDLLDEIRQHKKSAKAVKDKDKKQDILNKTAALAGCYRKDAARLSKQSHLSESHVAVKRKQLKAAKATVKGVLGRGLSFWKYMKSKLFFGLLSAGLSTLTLGAVEVETQKTKGGYDKKSKVVFSYWNNWKKDYNEFKAIAKAKPFGSMTTAHLFLKGVGELFIKPLRNLFLGVATVAGLLSLIPCPPLSAVCGAIAAVCATAGVILAMAKGALDAVLTTWNLLTLAINNNPRNTDLLRAQATSTGVNMLADALQAGSGFAGAAVGNAAGGAYNNAFDVMNKRKLTMGGSGDGGRLGSALISGARQGTTHGTKALGKLGTTLSETEAMGPGAKANNKFKKESQRKGHLPLFMPYQTPQESGSLPDWMNEEIAKDRQIRDEAQRGLAKKAGNQLSMLLNDTNRAAGKSSVLEANTNLADGKVKSEAGKKGNPSDIQDADKKNTQGMKESVKSGSASLKEFADNMKDGVKLAQKLAKAS
jgi:hypothetical protein